MGLRLYQPPVESDIPAKPTIDRAALSRSTIRRVLDRNEDRLRERRRRVLAAAAAYNSFDARRGLSAVEPPAIPPATTDSSGTRSGSEHGRRALRDAANRMSLLDERLAAVFGERWTNLHTETNPSPLRDEDNNPSPMLAMAVDSEFLPRRSRLRPEPTYTLSSIRSTQAPDHPCDTVSGRHVALPQTGGRWMDSILRADSRQSLNGPGEGSWSRPAAPSNRPWTHRTGLGTLGGVDGLGDRNRSLSPEGDNVWDTLLSTLTPDPQPPSVGSSFASATASASAAATQSNATASSRTSFTTQDTAEESAFDPPCDSGCDNSDTEGDDDEDEMDAIQPPRRRRTYAEVVRDSNDDPLELLGGIGGMQRIVRNLARREDIPDEWWAEVGLSRTLSREASSN
ncbi:efeca579-ab4c-4eba-8b90-5d7f5a472828 [Thermothielavioides terrestris]|uniref:Efeca579-ab4c-4eba-8b90-5d7f5a472828 n=1 Tax=Thermothielavioides terrestris TaxID=2587410 RepID=A0A446BHJ0_9PEZI|nr:efeca579-ab4c-4eba-8b90-5d7f5a472828 [Thermothielavioides terrestris]